MYEVELKVEISEEERDNLVKQFQRKGFQAKGVTPQNDFYVEAKASEYGGLDLKRYRQEGDTYIYTEKIWEMVGDTRARRENEYEVTREVMENEVAKFPEAIKIIKDREWFAGTYNGQELSITIDKVKFDHSPNVRFFIEAEIDVDDKYKVKETKEKIVQFLKELLNKHDGMLEAPGMLIMARDKK